MKRALQRAVSSDVDLSPSQPPNKIARMASAPATTSSNIMQVPIPISSTPIDKSGPEPDGWFLKHQNKALASELRAYKRQISTLTAERDSRRAMCSKAYSDVVNFSKSWVDLEINLGNLLGQSEVVQKIIESETSNSNINSNITKAKANNNNEMTDADDFDIGDDIDKRSVTGGGKSIETIDNLIDKITRIYSAGENHVDITALVCTTSTITTSTSDSQITIPSGALTERSSFVTSAVSALLSDVASNRSSRSAFPSNIFDSESAASQLILAKEQIASKDRELESIAEARDEVNKIAHKALRKLDKLATGSSLSEVLDDDGKAKKAKADAEKKEKENTEKEKDNAGEESKKKGEDAIKLAQAQDLCDHRLKKVEELQAEKTDLQRQITDLSNSVGSNVFGGVGGGGAGGVNSNPQSAALMEITNKLKTTEDRLRLALDLNSLLTPKYSTMEGKFIQSEKSLNEVAANNTKRWDQMLQEKDKQTSSFEREILTLKHKLGQSLEGARHAETYKSAMNEARLLSEKLQGQNVELKKKNTDLLKKKNASTAAVGAAPKGGGKESIEELLKQNADVRRKLGDANSTADSLVAEIESLAEQFETISKSNVRLLKLNSEKDQANTLAKSEVIKLKQMIEIGKDEKLALLRQAKDAEELSVVAKKSIQLGAQIKDEMLKEEKKFEDLQVEKIKKINQMTLERANVEAENAQLRASVASTEEEKNNLKKRCDELTQMQSTAVTEKSQLEEKMLLSARQAQSQSQSQFTLNGTVSEDVKLLLQQNALLKSQLTCHICNDREKNCILTRCMHMFCRTCIEGNLSIRKRNCPACNDRYSATDVKDVWLTG